jgi:pyrroline-5-carboxylate reductase
MVRHGATGLFANPLISSQQKESIQDIFNAVGIACWVDSEVQIDAVTAVSGSGPAYFFLVMEIMQKVAEEFGLPKQTARQLTLQTALGAAQMADTGSLDTTQLRKQVTSPGGTTHAAIETFIAGGLEESFRQAMQAAQNRAETMSKEFSSRVLIESRFPKPSQ